jgi:hypothetical protein
MESTRSEAPRKRHRTNGAERVSKAIADSRAAATAHVRSFAAAALLGAAFLAAARAPPEPPGRPADHVFVVMLDGTRPDVLRQASAIDAEIQELRAEIARLQQN